MRARLFLAVGLLLAVAGWALPASAQNRFNLVNNTGRQIDEVYVSSSRVSNWGPDFLGRNVLPPGQSFWVQPPFTDCVLDIRIVYNGGGAEERRGVNACQLSTIVWGGSGGGGRGSVAGNNPSFRFMNSTGRQIDEIYVSLSTDQNWGRDRLGDNVLPPGSYVDIRLPQSRTCTVDIKVVFAGGRSTERRGVETCSIEQLNFR